MEHPFINNLENKSLEELQTTISDLSSKLTFAYRTGNSALISQINMAIESYRSAYNKKMNELMVYSKPTILIVGKRFLIVGKQKHYKPLVNCRDRVLNV